MNNVIRIPYCWGWWTRLIALVFAVGWSWFVWRDPATGIGTWIARFFGVFVFMVAAVTGETLIDPSSRCVRREWRLFAVVPLISRTFSFELFREVRWRRRWVESELDSDHWVELVPKIGRALILTTFISHARDRSCGDANALALRISESLRIPFTRDPEIS